MSGHVLSRPAAPRVAVHGTTQGKTTSWLGWLAAAMQAIETRRRLAQMDDRMLQDIGISRGEALTEAGRAPWDVTPMPRRHRR